MSSVIGQLAPKLAGLTQAQQGVAEKALFGATAGRELNSTLLAGTTAYNLAAAAALKHGTATAAADTATSGLSGSMDKVKAAIADAGVTLGQKFLPILSTVMGWVAQAAQAFAYVLPGAPNILGIAFGVIGKVMGVEIGIGVFVVEKIITVIKGIVAAVQWVVGAVAGPIHAISAAFGGIGTVVATVFGGIAGAVKGAINGVIGIINFFIGLIDAIQVHIHVGPVGIDWNGLNLKKIPTLDTGGIVTKPTLALLAANSKPEAVIPMGSGQFAGGGGGGGGSTTNNFYVTTNDPMWLVNKLIQYQRSNGPLPVTVRRANALGS